MPTKPRSKKRQQKSSIWEIVDSEQAFEKHASSEIFTPLRELGLDGYTHWPSPINFRYEIEELACQNTWQARIKLYGLTAAWWFWSNLVPSPVELTRKFLLGGYKCGFYLPIRFKSPLTIFVGDEGVEFFAEIARPVTTFFFYWWVASSLFSALDTWHTVQLLVDECKNEGWECLKANGAQPANISGLTQGAGWIVLDDTFHKSGPISGVKVDDSVWDATGYVQVDTKGNPIDHIWLHIGDLGTWDQTVEIAVSPGGTLASGFIKHHGVTHGPRTIGLWCEVHFSGPWNGTFADIQFRRFTVTGVTA